MWEIIGNKIKNLKKEFASTLLSNVPHDVKKNTFSHAFKQNSRHVSGLYHSSSDQSYKMKMHMKHDTGNNSYKGLPEYVEINMSSGYFVQQKSQMIWPRVETESPGWEVDG
jgi:hypothetical protein